jgi:outer membrane lipoprotein carrier protein
MAWYPALGLCAALGLAAAPGVAAAQQAGAPAACAEPAARRIQAHYEKVRDLAARFEQTSRSSIFGTDTATSRGRVVFAKPGRMRWDYEEPEPSAVVSDGETLWIYDPKAREVQRLRVGEGFLSGAAMQFLLGQGDLLAEFEVHALSCTEAVAELDLVPRAPATYERLRIRAQAETGEVLETTVVDLFGNETRVAFSEVHVNRDPAPETFRFDAPEGVRVIELAPPP